MPKPSTSVGMELRRLRLAADLSQQELADLATVELSSLNRIERGRSKAPKTSTLVKLEKALGAEGILVAAAAGVTRPSQKQQALPNPDTVAQDLGAAELEAAAPMSEGKRRIIGMIQHLRDEVFDGIEKELEHVIGRGMTGGTHLGGIAPRGTGHRRVAADHLRLIAAVGQVDRVRAPRA